MQTSSEESQPNQTRTALLSIPCLPFAYRRLVALQNLRLQNKQQKVHPAATLSLPLCLLRRALQEYARRTIAMLHSLFVNAQTLSQWDAVTTEQTRRWRTARYPRYILLSHGTLLPGLASVSTQQNRPHQLHHVAKIPARCPPPSRLHCSLPGARDVRGFPPSPVPRKKNVMSPASMRTCNYDSRTFLKLCYGKVLS